MSCLSFFHLVVTNWQLVWNFFQSLNLIKSVIVGIVLKATASKEKCVAQKFLYLTNKKLNLLL